MKWGWFGLAALLLTGCILPVDVDIHDGPHVLGSGHVVAEFRPVGGYHAVVASGAAVVIVTRNGYEGVEIQAEDNLIHWLETRVVGGVLYLETSPGVNLSPRRDIVFYVDAARMVEIEASGAVRAELDLGWEPELYVTLSGAASLDAWGDTDYLDVQASGASHYRGLELRSRQAAASVSGAASAYVWATDRLDAWASGAGVVRYVGNPAVYASVSGAGSVGPY
jgi:hypothetical protein